MGKSRGQAAFCISESFLHLFFCLHALCFSLCDEFKSKSTIVFHLHTIYICLNHWTSPLHVQVVTLFHFFLLCDDLILGPFLLLAFSKIFTSPQILLSTCSNPRSPILQSSTNKTIIMNFPCSNQTHYLPFHDVQNFSIYFQCFNQFYLEHELDKVEEGLGIAVQIVQASSRVQSLSIELDVDQRFNMEYPAFLHFSEPSSPSTHEIM